jgi:hypothetical protein
VAEDGFRGICVPAIGFVQDEARQVQDVSIANLDDPDDRALRLESSARQERQHEGGVLSGTTENVIDAVGADDGRYGSAVFDERKRPPRPRTDRIR